MAPHHHRLMQDGLLESARLHGDKEAIVSNGLRYDYTALLDRASRIARILQDQGLESGDRVAIFLNNGINTAASIYGTWLAGGVSMVVNPQTKPDKLAFILSDSDARIVLTEPLLLRFCEKAYELLEPGQGAPVRVLPEGKLPVSRLPVLAAFDCPENDGCLSMEDLIGQTPASPDDPGIVATDLAALIYTSGSTGQPKGVMMTHQNMTFTLDSLIEYLRLDQSDRIINVLPLAFDYGLYQLLMAVRLGATLVLEQGFGFPAEIERRIREEAVTVLPGVPTVYSTMLSRAEAARSRSAADPQDSGGPASSDPTFPSVRRVTNTAAALSHEMIPGLQALFPNALVFKMYGLTECKRVCYLEPEELPARPSSVGKAIPGTQVFLLDTEGRPVPPGEVGILHVRGPHVMVGYWKNPDRTAEMLRPGRHPGERVLCTHDWFKMDGDGYLYFQGRSDDIIKSRGEKVSPIEVENVLYGIPGVQDAAVLGIADPLLGEAIQAYISVVPGKTVSERDIRRVCQEKLENFMVPRDIFFLPELPKSANGKVRKKDIVQRSPHAAD